MSFLLDTNVVSEWVKPRPDPGVVAWLSGADEDRLYLSVMTLAELRRGVERMADGARRKRLDTWLSHDLALRFEERILPIADSVADAWGKITARHEAAGTPIGVVDALIAATAEVHSLTLVTRNMSDFKMSVKTVINPWTA